MSRGEVLRSQDLLTFILHCLQPPSLRPLLCRVAAVSSLWRDTVARLVAGWAPLRPHHPRPFDSTSPQSSLAPYHFTLPLPPDYVAPMILEGKHTQSPFKAAALPDGKTIALSDDATGWVQVYDVMGTRVRDLSPLPARGSSLAICASAEHLYVFAGRQLLQLSLADGSILDEVSFSWDEFTASRVEGYDGPVLLDPCAMVHADGALYIADTHHDRVAIVDTEPFLVWRHGVGGRGHGPGQFQNPNGIAIFEGECFVSDRRNRRIQVFALALLAASAAPGAAAAAAGAYLREFGTPAKERGARRGPKDIAIDSRGRLLVVEADTVAVLTRTGVVLQLLELPGSERLTGLALSAAGVFVTECEKGRVHVLELTDGTCEESSR